jgi:hypothetical protein
MLPWFGNQRVLMNKTSKWQLWIFHEKVSMILRHPEAPMNECVSPYRNYSWSGNQHTEDRILQSCLILEISFATFHHLNFISLSCFIETLDYNSTSFINLTTSSKSIEEVYQHFPDLFFSFTKKNLEIHFPLTAKKLEWEVLIQIKALLLFWLNFY